MENPEEIRPGAGSAAEVNEDPLGFVVSGTYGWVILFIGLGLVAAWKKFAGPRYQRLQETQASNREVNHKDEEAALLRQRAMDASRLRLQAQMDAAVDRHKEKIQEKEEAKRKARLLVYENMKKGRSSASQEQTDSAESSQKNSKGGSLRGEYFPLMSSEPSACFRSSRRGGGSAGG